MQSLVIRVAEPGLVATLVADHLWRVEADLIEAKRTMLHRLGSLAVQLPPGDPDRRVLEACIGDLADSILRRDER